MQVFISLVLTVLAIVGTFFTVGGQRFSVFFDLPSFIICILFPLLFVTILKGFSGLKTAFAIKSNDNISKETFIKANLFFKMYSKITWLSCVLAITIAAVDYLANAESIQALGPRAALAFMAILYTSIINIIITPFVIYTKEKLGEMN